MRKLCLVTVPIVILLIPFIKIKDKKSKYCSIITAVVFEISLLLGRTVMGSNLVGIVLILAEIVLWVEVFFLIYYFLNGFSKKKGNHIFRRISQGNKVWLIVWGVMFLCYLPCYFSFYPGIMSYDSKRITEQALGLRPFDNFQPFLHTILWTACIRLEQWCGIEQCAIVVYSCMQMLILTFVFTLVLRFMVNRGIHKAIVIGAFLMYAFCPSIVLFSFITTKDILFGAFFLLMVIQLIDLCGETSTFIKDERKCFLFILTGVICCLLRNNMIYVVVVGGFIMSGLIREYWKKIMAVFLMVICGYFIISGPVYSVIGVMPGYSRELLSVPLSQLANVYQKEKNDMDSLDKEEMVEFIPDIEKYDRQFADPIKYTFNEEKYECEKTQFWKLWLKYFGQKPSLYADAFLALNAPLWYMECDTVDPYISLGLFSRHYTFEYKDRLPSVKTFYTKVAGYNEAKGGWLRFPVIKEFFSVALPVWMLFIAFCSLIAQGKVKWLVPIVPMFVLWLTYLLGPVSNFRYMFPIIISYPVIIMVVCQNARLEKKMTEAEELKR